jgi:hypothetical protein
MPRSVKMVSCNSLGVETLDADMGEEGVEKASHEGVGLSLDTLLRSLD